MTSPMPSQSAREHAKAYLDAYERDEILLTERTLAQALHAAEQRGMEKAADEVERLRAENTSLRAENERLSQYRQV